MKIQIRKGLFETNSSSIHAISIHKNTDMSKISIPTELNIHHGEFGWERESYTDMATKLSYLYEMACAADADKKYWEENLRKCLNHDERVWYDEDKCKKNLEKFPSMEGSYVDALVNALYEIGVETVNLPHGENYGYIDHSDGWDDLIFVFLNDHDMIIRFLFDGVSMVGTGNDNSYEDSDDPPCPASEDDFNIYHKYN